MSRDKSRSLNWAISLLLVCTFLAALSAGPNSTLATGPLQTSQERLVVGEGSSVCDFATGFGIGLGVGGLFGCIPCGVGGLAIDVATHYLCK